jgi:hypothetical protein
LWFSPGTPSSSTTKTGRHDIAEILLKVALNTINKSNQIISRNHIHVHPVPTLESWIVELVKFPRIETEVFTLFQDKIHYFEHSFSLLIYYSGVASIEAMRQLPH